MKIVILADGIPPEGKGGAERIAWQSALALQKAGHEIVVISTTRMSAAQTSESMVEGVQVFLISSNYQVRWRAWRALYNPGPVREVRRLLKRIRPDIVHAHNVHQYLSYAVFGEARAAGARVFHTIHDAMPFNYDKLSNFVDPKNSVCKTADEEWNYKVSSWKQFTEYRLRYNPIRNVVIRHQLKNLDTIFAVSNELLKALEQNGIHNVQVLHNGIDAKYWEISQTLVEQFIQEKNLVGKKILLFGGRITGSKGGDALLAALPAVARAIPEAMLVLMGTENDYVRKLKDIAEKEGVGAHITTTGWIEGDTLTALYHAASVVIVPSLYLDPLPTVVLEAMACAKPVIGSCLGGTPEMVEDGVTGYVVHPLNTQNLAVKIIEMLSDTVKAALFGNAGALRQKEMFSEDLQTQRLIEFYKGSAASGIL